MFTPVSFHDRYEALSPQSQAWIADLVDSLLESETQDAQRRASRTPSILPFVRSTITTEIPPADAPDPSPISQAI